ncbi:MAG: hypothetical protein GEV10_14535 [Streptosporangiales bacterium]|nr:hypothetical protein [Streptosporangiales bacterium]
MRLTTAGIHRLARAMLQLLHTLVDALTDTGHDGENADNLFGGVDAVRIPVEYLGEPCTAGDPESVRRVLRNSPPCAYMRAVNLGEPPDESVAEAAGPPVAASDVSLYEVHNNGNWYDFGFILGIAVVFSGPARLGGPGASRGRGRPENRAHEVTPFAPIVRDHRLWVGPDPRRRLKVWNGAS